MIVRENIVIPAGAYLRPSPEICDFPATPGFVTGVQVVRPEEGYQMCHPVVRRHNPSFRKHQLALNFERKQLMKTKLASALVMALTLALVLIIIPAMVIFNSVTYNGQGFTANGAGGFALQTEICDKSDGAEVAGPYLFWTLTAPGARNAEIYGPWGDAIMARSGTGTFTFVSEWYDPQQLAAYPVKAAYDGRPQGATLVVSHGCDPDW